MNEKEKLIPQRRFKEFKNTGTWEQRKLGEFADISTGKLDANAMVEDGEYDFYTSGMKKYRIDTPAFEGPAITIAGNGATVGYMHLADGEFNAYQRTYVLQNFQANRYFLYSEISKKLPRKIAQEARTGNIPYIVMDMLTELTISLPVLEEEQAKIGAFFKQLDNTIALHQRKLEKSKALKSAYLSDMFPAEGDRKPKRRFAGFTDDWEQRKLKELTEVITKGTTPKDKSGKGSINFVKVENINKSSGEIDIKSKITENEHEGYLKRSQLKDGDILFSIAGTLGRTAIVKKELLPANTNQALAVIRLDEGDKNYITTFLNGRAAEDFIKKNPTVGAQPNLSLEQVGNLLIEIPSLEEQTKIGSFFKQLDDTIALHQHKLEKLQNIKQAYLNELFV